MSNAVDLLHWGHAHKTAPCKDGLLCLFHPQNSRDECISNLVLFDSQGALMWSAQLFQSHDAYVDFSVDANNAITAWTFSAYILRIDPETGECFDPVFTK